MPNNEIQELRHQVHVLDRQRKALRAEAMVLGIRGKKKLADAKRSKAKTIDSQILRLNKRIDQLLRARKPLIKIPPIKLPKKAKPAKQAKPAGKPVSTPLEVAKAARAQMTFQPSAASAQAMPSFPEGGGFPSVSSGGGGGFPGSGSEFQPSAASFSPGTDPAAAGADTSSEGGPSVFLILGTAAVLGVGGYYFWKKSKGKKPTLLSGPTSRPTTAPTTSAAPKPTTPARPFMRTGFLNRPLAAGK